MIVSVENVVAWVALALYLTYAVASHRELGEARGSDGLRALNTVASVAIVVALIVAGWPT